MKTLLIVLSAFAIVLAGCAKNEGCTYPDATNYNPDAVVDDGSCNFNLASTDDNNSSNEEETVAETWSGNYLVNETVVFSDGGFTSTDELEYNISISVVNETKVLLQNFLGCDEMEANVDENSIVPVNLNQLEGCYVGQLNTSQIENGFSFEGIKSDGFVGYEISGTVVRL